MNILRLFRRAPGYALALFGMMALGSAFLVTTFSQVDATLFRSPPFPAPDRLVMLYTLHSNPREVETRRRWPYPKIQLLRELSADIASVASYSATLLTLTADGSAEAVPGEIASPEYFSLLGAKPILGRTFTAEENRIPGGGPVVILGHGLWLRRFGADSAVLNRSVRINGQSLTVIGVIGAGFKGLTNQAELWIPPVMAPVLTYPEYLTTPQYFISAVARLNPGVTPALANERVRLVYERIGRELPDPEAEPGESVSAAAVPLNDARVNPVTRRSLTLLLAGSVLLHLLATANVINLMLGRAVARRREAAILLAMGGSTWRRAFHLAADSALLVLSGCLAGTALAWLLAPLLQLPPDAWGPRSMYGSLSPFSEPGFGPRVLWFGVVVALLTTLLACWAPLLTLIRPAVLGFLRDGAGASRVAASLRRPSLRGMIVAAEAGLAVMLLVAGGLLVDSFRRMMTTDLGVKADRVLTFWLRPSEARVPPEQAPAFLSRILAAISAVPGVEAVSVDGGAPVSGSARSTLIIDSHPPATPQDAPSILRHYIGPDHFQVLGVPLLRGRLFNDGDRDGSPRVAIISQTAARRFWPDRDPIGERIWFGGGSSFDSRENSAEIVGIVGDVVYEPLDVRDNRSSFYTPYQQFTYSSRVVLVKTEGNPLEVVGGIRQAVAGVDRDLPLVELQTLKDQIGGSWRRQRFDAAVFGGLALLALVLAAAGVYSVVSFAVGQRTREMGIRLALGAEPGAILRLVIGEGMVFPILGLLFGVAGSVAVVRLLRGSLYGIAPGDPKVPLIAIAVLLVVAVAACYFPARLATRVDPARTLRSE